MSTNQENSPEKAIDSSAFALAEYTSLRDELLKRIDFQHQILALTLVGAGTFLTVGTQASTPDLLLIYPILVLFLATGWYQHNLRVYRIETYIRTKIESRVPGAGWEQARVNKTGEVKLSATVWFARGVFVGTQIVTLIAAFSKPLQSQLDTGLLIADLVAILATWIIVRRMNLM